MSLEVKTGFKDEKKDKGFNKKKKIGESENNFDWRQCREGVEGRA